MAFQGVLTITDLSLVNTKKVPTISGVIDKVYDTVYVGDLPEGVDVPIGAHDATVCSILFLEIRNHTLADEYGLSVKVDGEWRHFIGKANQEGKFGIALFDMPTGEYEVAIYTRINDNISYSGVNTLTVG